MMNDRLHVTASASSPLLLSSTDNPFEEVSSLDLTVTELEEPADYDYSSVAAADMGGTSPPGKDFLFLPLLSFFRTVLSKVGTSSGPLQVHTRQGLVKSVPVRVSLKNHLQKTRLKYTIHLFIVTNYYRV